MKTAIKSIIFILACIISLTSFGQDSDTTFQKINTKNGLDLECRAIDEGGDPLPMVASVDNIPQYPGGFKTLVRFLRKELTYPETAIRDNIQGRVLTSFIVDKDGNINDIKIVYGIRNDLDSSCIRALSRMPNWVPGTNWEGERISFQFNLSFVFQLKQPKKKQ